MSPVHTRRAALLWLAGLALVAYSAAIATTGGVDVTVGGMRIRSRTWQRPALIGLVVLAGAALADRRRALAVARQTVEAVTPRWNRVARGIPPGAVAGLAAAWVMAAGVTFGTNVAGGSDSSGYLNQAKLLSRGRLLEAGRLTGDAPWRDALYTFAPLGYRIATDDERLAPTYPPGYPLLLAPALLIHERVAFLIVPLCAALTVWLTFVLGRRLGEPWSAAAAAVLVSSSPALLYQAVQPMSDVPATAAWLLALGLALSRDFRAAPALAGLAAGAAILIRPNLMPLAALVWAACALDQSGARRWRRPVAAVAATVPAIVALGVIQALRYGSAFESGYGAAGDLFSLENVWPNLQRYPRWMIETHTPLIALFVLAPLWIVRCGRVRQHLLLLWLFATAVVLAYLPYVYFQTFEWTYIRFLLPAIPIMWLLVLVPSTALARRMQPAGGILIAVAVCALAVFSIRVARDRLAFDLQSGEQKYVFSARVVNWRLPPNSVAIAMQHSGSLWYYTGRPIVRWDFLDPRQLDLTVEWLASNGYSPFLVADGEEVKRIEERFRPAAQRSLDRMHAVGQFGDVTIFAFD
jgi:4-amino-4-deoxy-L-arabinose transferase-like glycosyltransferase